MDHRFPIEKSSSRTDRWVENHFIRGQHIFDITSEFDSYKSLTPKIRDDSCLEPSPIKSTCLLNFPHSLIKGPPPHQQSTTHMINVTTNISSIQNHLSNKQKTISSANTYYNSIQDNNAPQAFKFIPEPLGQIEYSVLQGSNCDNNPPKMAFPFDPYLPNNFPMSNFQNICSNANNVKGLDDPNFINSYMYFMWWKQMQLQFQIQMMHFINNNNNNNQRPCDALSMEYITMRQKRNSFNCNLTWCTIDNIQPSFVLSETNPSEIPENERILSLLKQNSSYSFWNPKRKCCSIVNVLDDSINNNIDSKSNKISSNGGGPGGGGHGIRNGNGNNNPETSSSSTSSMLNVADKTSTQSIQPQQPSSKRLKTSHHGSSISCDKLVIAPSVQSGIKSVNVILPPSSFTTRKNNINNNFDNNELRNGTNMIVPVAPSGIALFNHESPHPSALTTQQQSHKQGPTLINNSGGSSFVKSHTTRGVPERVNVNDNNTSVSTSALLHGAKTVSNNQGQQPSNNQPNHLTLSTSVPSKDISKLENSSAIPTTEEQQHDFLARVYGSMMGMNPFLMQQQYMAAPHPSPLVPPSPSNNPHLAAAADAYYKQLFNSYPFGLIQQPAPQLQHQPQPQIPEFLAPFNLFPPFFPTGVAHVPKFIQGPPMAASVPLDFNLTAGPPTTDFKAHFDEWQGQQPAIHLRGAPLPGTRSRTPVAAGYDRNSSNSDHHKNNSCTSNKRDGGFVSSSSQLQHNILKPPPFLVKSMMQLPPTTTTTSSPIVIATTCCNNNNSRKLKRCPPNNQFLPDSLSSNKRSSGTTHQTTNENSCDRAGFLSKSTAVDFVKSLHNNNNHKPPPVNHYNHDNTTFIHQLNNNPYFPIGIKAEAPILSSATSPNSRCNSPSQLLPSYYQQYLASFMAAAAAHQNSQQQQQQLPFLPYPMATPPPFMVGGYPLLNPCNENGNLVPQQTPTHKISPSPHFDKSLRMLNFLKDVSKESPLSAVSPLPTTHVHRVTDNLLLKKSAASPSPLKTPPASFSPFQSIVTTTSFSSSAIPPPPLNLNEILENVKNNQQQQQPAGCKSNLHPKTSTSNANSSGGGHKKMATSAFTLSARNEKFPCLSCGKVFGKESQLTLHMNVHYFEKPFRCEICSTSFRNKGAFNKHKCAQILKQQQLQQQQQQLGGVTMMMTLGNSDDRTIQVTNGAANEIKSNVAATAAVSLSLPIGTGLNKNDAPINVENYDFEADSISSVARAAGGGGGKSPFAADSLENSRNILHLSSKISVTEKIIPSIIDPITTISGCSIIIISSTTPTTNLNAQPIPSFSEGSTAVSISDPRPFKCDDCQVAFRIQGHLAKHLRSKMHITGLEKNGKVPSGTYAFFDQRASLNDIDTSSCAASLGSLHRLLKQNFKSVNSALVVNNHRTLPTSEHVVVSSVVDSESNSQLCPVIGYGGCSSSSVEDGLDRQLLQPSIIPKVSSDDTSNVIDDTANAFNPSSTLSFFPNVATVAAAPLHQFQFQPPPKKRAHSFTPNAIPRNEVCSSVYPGILSEETTTIVSTTFFSPLTPSFLSFTPSSSSTSPSSQSYVPPLNTAGADLDKRNEVNQIAPIVYSSSPLDVLCSATNYYRKINAS